ncbi:MAG: alanine racemase [Gammaproteobacteria bacterium]|uniref:Alanine racemase n=1 Tax=Candidatus Thiopontia autotrophica TaxID=2841688 RepID=A0A8J6PB52_9GAMM|nr:alanine racemase [Candidatus Thiopontia autotrophica]MBL6968760.1 alanine racemase [Gammaproteobacteria bacterium]
MSRQVTATINLEALRHNLQQARDRVSDQTQVVAVIKANGYGHGLLTVAHALYQADMFAVGCLDEAVQLRSAGVQKPILLLEGFEGEEELHAASQLDLQTVVHSKEQWSLLKSTHLKRSLVVWLKVDSGMHRLGFYPQRVDQLLPLMEESSCVDQLVLISHFANADKPDHKMNQQQQELFETSGQQLDIRRSMANSAALLSDNSTHYDFVRPGIMLYGGSPFSQQSADSIGLKPVMTLKAPLIAVKKLQRGDCVGYGSTWCAPEDMSIGVVAIGYGHGYPRSLPTGTPVLIRDQRVPLVGRVSMDMITVDLTEVPDAMVGDRAILWGDGLPIEEIADKADTISYELLCQLTSRVRREEG